jgi:transcriptional regulator with XRE-family HTH domain
MVPVNRHWTTTSVSNFVYRISFDFVAQLRLRLEQKNISRAKFAQDFGVSESRVSQIFNNPGNLGLESMTRAAQAAGMKVAVVAYDDGDPQNQNGPVNPEIFVSCWKRAGMPKDFFDLESVRLHQFESSPLTEPTLTYTSRYFFVDRSVTNRDTQVVNANA